MSPLTFVDIQTALGILNTISSAQQLPEDAVNEIDICRTKDYEMKEIVSDRWFLQQRSNVIESRPQTLLRKESGVNESLIVEIGSVVFYTSEQFVR